MALLVATLVLVIAVFIIFLASMEHQIIYSNADNLQAYYLSEGKIFMALYKDEYYNDQLLPRLETYIKYGRLSPFYDPYIRLKEEDLIEGDKFNTITTRFYYKNNRNYVDLITSSNYRGINSEVVARIIILNDLFELGHSIISRENISGDQMEKYEYFFSHIEENIKIPATGNDILGMEVNDYDMINILRDTNKKMNIEFYRNGMEGPVKSQVLTKDEIFLLAKNNSSKPVRLTILSEEKADNLLLKGIIYIEGDLEILNDFEFHGILILNGGHLYIAPLVNFEVEGIVFMKDYIQDDSTIHARYNFDKIIKYGNYLPMFIYPKIELIKSN